jgi:hypothetical protein
VDHEISIPRFVDFIQPAITNIVGREVRKTSSSYKQMDVFAVILKNKPFSYLILFRTFRFVLQFKVRGLL